MNYYGSKELAESFRVVRKNTIAIATDIGEEHYQFRSSPETRTVEKLLTHIALGPSFAENIHGNERLTSLIDFDFTKLVTEMVAQEGTSRTKAQVVDLLREGGERYATWVESVSDDFLGEMVTMRPNTGPAAKTRFEMLLGVKEHEMHHRGQLMLIERMLGITPHLTREFQARMAAMAATAAKQ